MYVACLLVLSIFYRYNLELGEITQHNIKQLKRLNQVVFPVSYNDKFYKDVLDLGELAKLGESSDSISNIISRMRVCSMLAVTITCRPSCVDYK